MFPEMVRAFAREFGPVATNFSDPVTCMDVISKPQFDEFSLPYIKKLIDGTEKIMGSRPGAHICGKTSPIWKDLADAGCFLLVLITARIWKWRRKQWETGCGSPEMCRRWT